MRLAAFALLALIAKWPLLASAAMMNDFRDAQYFTLFEEAARTTVVRFHELPLWNPYYCGGIPALGIPSARFASPPFLLTLLFGTLRANALIAFAMSVLGLEGTFRYARARGSTALGAFAAAPVFAMAGFFARASALDWINFYGFELVPWAALGIHSALRGSRRGAVVAAFALAWMIGQGGTYAGPFMLLVGLFELVEAVGRAFVRRKRRPMGQALVAIMGMAAMLGLLALALSAFRLWPVIENLATSPRILGGAPGNGGRAVWHSVFGDASLARGEMLIGVLVLPAVLASFWRKRTLPIVVVAAVWIWLALGYSVRPSLFAELRRIPPYTMLRYPERFLALFGLVAAVAAALGVTELSARARKRKGWRIPLVIVTALLLGNVVLPTANDHAEAKGRALVAPPVDQPQDFHQARGNRWLAAYYPGIGRGSLSCFDDYNVAQSAALRGDLAEEETLADPTAGTIARESWTPNALDLHVAVTRPARVIVNQNFHPGWRASVGEVVSDAGRIAVDLPAGTHALHLHFAPRSATGGAAVSLLGLLVAIAIWRRAGATATPIAGRRAWAKQLALTAAPLFAVPLSFALVREPERPTPPLLTPQGEPLVVGTPPPTSRPLHVHFEGGVELEAAALHFSRAFDAQVVTLELDWKRPAAIPAGLGIFVHIEAPGSDTLGADHVLIGNQVPLEGAPADQTLRDVTAPIGLPTTTEPRHWTVRVGLWKARAGGARLGVRDPGQATITDNAVEIESFDTP